VLAPGEPLFLRGGEDPSVHDQRRGRIVEDGVDTENTHGTSRSVG
jgi:hypothetical protein